MGTGTDKRVESPLVSHIGVVVSRRVLFDHETDGGRRAHQVVGHSRAIGQAESLPFSTG